MQINQVTNNLLLEVTTEQALECRTVASFVLAHFMNSVMDGIVAEFLSALGQSKLAFGSASFGSHTEFQVLLGVRIDDFAQEFSKLGGMFSFFESDTLVSFGHFRESFAVRLATHRKVHAHFGTFSSKVLAQSLHHFGIQTLSDTDLVLVCPDNLATGRLFDLFEELALRSVALRAFIRSFRTHVDVTANFANPDLHIFSFSASRKLIKKFVINFVIITNIKLF